MRSIRLRTRLSVERLETREVPANFTAASVAELTAGITASNQTPEADTITLAPSKTFTLTAANNIHWKYSSTGLPIIEASGGLTIVGNGSTIERSTARGTPDFRLFVVDYGASLTLENLTIQGGRAPLGGGIYNAGSLSLQNCTIQNNVAFGGGWETWTAAGGGIFSGSAWSTLTAVGSTIRNNQALGLKGRYSKDDPDAPGGNAHGGGLYVGGSATMLGTSVYNNVANGGTGLHRSPDGQGIGGGVYISGSAVSIDAFTLTHITNNKASSFDQDISGSYTLLP